MFAPADRQEEKKRENQNFQPQYSRGVLSILVRSDRICQLVMGHLKLEIGC